MSDFADQLHVQIDLCEREIDAVIDWIRENPELDHPERKEKLERWRLLESEVVRLGRRLEQACTTPAPERVGMAAAVDALWAEFLRQRGAK